MGDVIADELPEAHSQRSYTLTLDADTTLSIYVDQKGMATEHPFDMLIFDPALSIYDEQGNLLIRAIAY